MCHCQSSLLALHPFKAEYFALRFWFQSIRLHELSLIQTYKAMPGEGDVIFFFFSFLLAVPAQHTATKVSAGV